MAEYQFLDLAWHIREYDEWEIYKQPEKRRCGACGEENYVSDMNFEKDVQNYVCIPCLNNRDYNEVKSYIKPIKL